MEFIDCHSHIAIQKDGLIVGKDAFWSKVPNINEYETLCIKNKVSTALLTPCPSPVIEAENYIEFVYLWNCCRGKFTYFSKICADGKTYENKIMQNPYKKINDIMYDYFSKYKNSNLKVYYIPLVNLMFDTPDYLNELYEKGAKAFKVHGIAIGLNDYSKIKIELLNFIREHDIPLIIHTDYYENPTKPIEMLYQVSDPLNWLELLDENNIRGYLAHSARFCMDSAKIINSTENYVVGLSPERLLISEPLRLKEKISADKYLKLLEDLFNEDSILFDMDYPWNVSNRNSDELDLDIQKRLENSNFSKEKVKKIGINNAKRFFKL